MTWTHERLITRFHSTRPMKTKTCSLKKLLTLSTIAVLLGASPMPAQDKSMPLAPGDGEPPSGNTGSNTTRVFDELADKALRAMERRAGELKIKGVAVIAYAQGDQVQSWSSKMLVIGNLATAPSANNKGSNLLGIAYAKAAEMAATLKDSGSGVRPPLTGEFGWQGGVVSQGKTGILIAAFSGGPSEDDVRVSRAGLEILQSAL